MFFQEILISGGKVLVNDKTYEVIGPIDSKVRLKYLFAQVKCSYLTMRKIDDQILFRRYKKTYFLPLNDLIFMAQNTHKKHFKTTDFQLASLMS